jgi:DNA invertase Pin-like site-specific DNA recombinase
MSRKELTNAVAYLRTSSASNVGGDKDSDKRQLAAINRFGKAAGFEIAGTYYDAAVSGADSVMSRPGFAAMLERWRATASGP